MRAQYEIGFDDVDYARVLYHARYYSWVDRTLITWFHEHGLSYRDLSMDLHVSIPIQTSHCRYRGPLQFEDRFEVRLAIEGLSQRGFRLSFHVVRLADDFVVAEGYEDRRFVDFERRRPADPPEALYALLETMASESAGNLAAREPEK
jgi:acyl-CoA thioester hydrolase